MCKLLWQRWDFLVPDCVPKNRWKKWGRRWQTPHLSDAPGWASGFCPASVQHWPAERHRHRVAEIFLESKGHVANRTQRWTQFLAMSRVFFPLSLWGLISWFGCRRSPPTSWFLLWQLTPQRENGSADVGRWNLSWAFWFFDAFCCFFCVTSSLLDPFGIWSSLPLRGHPSLLNAHGWPAAQLGKQLSKQRNAQMQIHKANNNRWFQVQLEYSQHELQTEWLGYEWLLDLTATGFRISHEWVNPRRSLWRAQEGPGNGWNRTDSVTVVELHHVNWCDFEQIFLPFLSILYISLFYTQSFIFDSMFPRKMPWLLDLNNGLVAALACWGGSFGCQCDGGFQLRQRIAREESRLSGELKASGDFWWDTINLYNISTAQGGGGSFQR